MIFTIPTHLCGVGTETKATNGGSRVEALGFQGFGTVFCLEVLTPRHPSLAAEVRYLDLPNIPKTPNLRRYDWMSRLHSCLLFWKQEQKDEKIHF